MGSARLKQAEILHIATSLGVTHRATLDFFAQRDSVIKRYYPSLFNHWARGERHFNLVSSESRRAIRFEPNRFVVRVEGQPDLNLFEETIQIAKELLAEFRVSDLFGMTFASVRSQMMKSLEDTRSTFAKDYLTNRSHRLLTFDPLTDFAVVAERRWPASTEFEKTKSAVAPLRILERVTVGPVSYEEVGERWVEFKRDAKNKLYETPHVAHQFGILADTSFEAERRKKDKVLATEVLWRFCDWAKKRADKTWEEVEA